MTSTTRPSSPNPSRAARPRRRAKVRAGGAAYAAGHTRLASSHDRQTARERNAAERARVEEMLASAPLPTDRPRARWTAPVTPRPARSTPRLRAVPAQVTGCPVCASTKVTTDEVGRPGGMLRLSECLQCDHRWTERPSRRFAELGGAMGRRGAPVLTATR